jgi:hypothetical protein
MNIGEVSMLDLAISIDTDQTNTTIIETNHGVELRAPDWPQDCDFQLVAFDPRGRSCEVIPAECVADDIGEALMTIERTAVFANDKPDWSLRLELYASRGRRRKKALLPEKSGSTKRTPGA